MPCACGEHKTQEVHFEDEFIEIAYLIILNKIRYYHPEKSDGRESIHDDQYDRFEMRYLQLCDILGLPNELVHKAYGKVGDWEIPPELDGHGMMEVDWEHDMVQAVYADMANWPGGSKRVKRRT